MGTNVPCAQKDRLANYTACSSIISLVQTEAVVQVGPRICGFHICSFNYPWIRGPIPFLFSNFGSLKKASCFYKLLNEMGRR